MTLQKEPIRFDDLDDGMAGSGPADALDVRGSVHIINGGEVSDSPCQRCGGSGLWRGYARTFTCKSCGGTGRTTTAKNAAFKGMQTKQRNRDAWQDEHAELIGQLRAISEWNTFAQSLLADIEAYGTLKDWKVDKARSMLAKIAAKREEKREERQQSRGGAVDVSRIEQLFDKARESGLKRLKFRTEYIEISVPKETSRNAGRLYVKHDGAYAGKIMNGKFMPGFDAKPDTLALVCEVAEDPAGRAKQYGIRTGVCSCCGAELTDPVSIANGIGPICTSNWGL